MMNHVERMRQKCTYFLDEDVYNKVRLSQLLYDDPFLGMLVTNDDQVYGFGADTKNNFGFGQVSQDPQLTIVRPLCGRNVCKFAAGKSHILALTRQGNVYAWGTNEHGELGQNNSNSSRIPLVVAGGLAHKVVLDIACGSNHSLALTDDGKVYSWGKNSYGQCGFNRKLGKIKTPQKIVEFDKEEIKQISTNSFSSICLSNEGTVFSFGYNSYGYLGIDSTSKTSTPTRVKIPAYVEKIRCGVSHTLALTNTGLLFVWGSNDNGQLGIGNTSYQTSPTRVNFSVDDNFNFYLMDIETSAEYTSHAVDILGNTYVWGLDYDGLKILRPKKCVKGVRNYRENLMISTGPVSRTERGLIVAFGDKNISDFIITVESKPIHVHRSVLETRSEYFRKKFSSDWKEADETIDIESHSFLVYRTFLQYIYSGELEKVNVNTTLRLLDLAHLVKDESLMTLCSDYLRQLVRFDNVAQVFRVAFMLSVTKLMDYCVRYAMRDMASVVKSEAFLEMTGNDVKALLRECVDRGLFFSELKAINEISCPMANDGGYEIARAESVPLPSDSSFSIANLVNNIFPSVALRLLKQTKVNKKNNEIFY